jgi:hypothetical protein
LSRTLLLGWSLWLLVSWSINLALFPARRTWVIMGDGVLLWRTPAEAFIPMVRGMLVSVLLGLMLVWPVWRLSQASDPRPGRRVVLDLLSMWLIAQVVIVPLRLLADLPAPRLGLISLTLAAWGAATGVVVWIGWWSQLALRRSAAMLACIALVSGAWPVAVVLQQPALAAASPFQTLWSVVDLRIGDRLIIVQLAMLAAGTAVAWLAAMMVRLMSPPRPRDSDTQ